MCGKLRFERETKKPISSMVSLLCRCKGLSKGSHGTDLPNIDHRHVIIPEFFHHGHSSMASFAVMAPVALAGKEMEIKLT
jgi:hypothetical protein